MGISGSPDPYRLLVGPQVRTGGLGAESEVAALEQVRTTLVDLMRAYRNPWGRSTNTTDALRLARRYGDTRLLRAFHQASLAMRRARPGARRAYVTRHAPDYRSTDPQIDTLLYRWYVSLSIEGAVAEERTAAARADRLDAFPRLDRLLALAPLETLAPLRVRDLRLASRSGASEQCIRQWHALSPAFASWRGGEGASLARLALEYRSGRAVEAELEYVHTERRAGEIQSTRAYMEHVPWDGVCEDPARWQSEALVVIGPAGLVSALSGLDGEERSPRSR